MVRGGAKQRMGETDLAVFQPNQSGLHRTRKVGQVKRQPFARALESSEICLDVSGGQYEQLPAGGLEVSDALGERAPQGSRDRKRLRQRCEAAQLAIRKSG